MAKSAKRKPSFDPPPAATSTPGSGWVYRSDADQPKPDDAPPTATPPPSAAMPPPAAATPPSAAKTTAVPGDLSQVAERIVDRYANYSAAAGLVPVPIVDAAAIGAVQLSMLGALSDHYGLPFTKARGQAIIASLLGGVMPALAGHQILKVFGPLAGMLTVSGFAVAATRAVGRVFIAHFSAGGTLADIDLDESRRRVTAELSRA
jgi:uncharacterized protein (DUF697 family)